MKIKKRNDIYLYSKKYYKYEFERLIARGVSSDLRLAPYIRLYYDFKVINEDLKISKIGFWCSETYKTQSLSNPAIVFRAVFRENASFTNFSGIKRASW